jgi:hypothetical protein
MRSCDNCGALNDGLFCIVCGKPFPPPVPPSPQQEQVEFRPAAAPQQPVYRQRPLGQEVHLPAPGEDWGYTHETYRPYGAAEMSFVHPPGKATGAMALGVISILLSVTGGFGGIIFGILALIYGSRGKRKGLEGAGTAIGLGWVGIFLSVMFALVWYLLP